MLSMTAALARIKGRVADAVPPELIRRLSHEVGHTWRERDLGPGVTTPLFLQQVLYGNVAVAELRRLSGLSFTDAAYCQARARLPRALLERLQRSVTDTLFDTTKVRPAQRWLGHRAFLLDGSSFSMPDTPALQAHFGQPGGQAEGCDFPVAHLMARFDAATGLLLRTAALPLRSHDLAGVPAMHADLRPGRRAGRGPGVRLVRAPGIVPAAGRPRRFPGSPEADHQLPPASAARHRAKPQGG